MEGLSTWRARVPLIFKRILVRQSTAQKLLSLPVNMECISWMAILFFFFLARSFLESTLSAGA